MQDDILQGTLSNPKAKTITNTKLRRSILEMLSAGENPDFVKYAHYRHGYDPDEIEGEIETYQKMTGKQPTSNDSGFQSEYSTQIRDAINSFKAESERNGAMGAIAAIKYSKDISKMLKGEGGTVETGPIIGRKQQMEARYLDRGSDEFIKFDAATTAFTANFIKALSGVQVSDKEREFLMNALPSSEKQERENKLGMEQITNFLKDNYEFKLGMKLDPDRLYGTDTENLDNPQMNSQMSSRISPQDDQAFQWAQSNPNDPRSAKVMEILKKKNYFSEEDTLPEIPQTPTPDAGTPTAVSEPQTPELPLRDKVADKAAGFLGIKKFGQGIGTTLFLMTKEGKELQKKAQEGDKNALETLNQLLAEAPTNKEVLGSAAMTGLTVLSGGLAGRAGNVAKATGIGTKVAKGAAAGYAYDVASDLEQNKDMKEVVTPGLGTAIGAAAPVVSKGIQAYKKMKQLKVSENAKKAVGQILQGKTKDVEKGLRTLSQVETKGVKTYRQLKEKLSDNLNALGAAMDDVLSQDPTKRTLSQLEKVTNVGDKEVKTNFVKQALENLDELYIKTNDPVSSQQIKNLVEKANSQGLTVKEINDVAIEYGRKFGKKAFNKIGEPLTSVNAVAYENTRKGVKETLRSLLPDDTSRLIDKNFTDHLRVSDLVDEMIENVNKISQKVGKRGLIEKAGNVVGKTADLATGHGLRGIASGLLPSNVGLKTMNALDLEKALLSNLKLVHKDTGGSSRVGTLASKIGQTLTRDVTLDDMKKLRPGLNLQDISAYGAEARKKMNELITQYEKAPNKQLKKRAEKAIRQFQESLKRKN